MSRLLPFKTETAPSPDDPQVLDLGDEATDEALSALSSETARKILSTVYEEPKTPPEIRDEVGTSLQNVHYHVENLEDAALIQPAGTGYSEKGTEMTVYAPANEAVVLFAGREHDRSRLKAALTRLLGAVGILALASVAVRRAVESLGTGVDDAGESLADGPATATATPTPSEGDDVGAVATTPTAEATATEAPARETPTEAVVDGTPEPAGTPTAAGTADPTASPPPTDAPSQTPTPDPAGTPAPTGTPTATEQPLSTPTDVPVATETGTPVPTPADTPVPTGTPTETMAAQTPSATTTSDAAGGAADGLLSDPAVAFFLGGLFMLVVVAAWWYLRS